MSRIFRVEAEVTATFYVIADDEEHAEQVAQDYADEAISDDLMASPFTTVMGEVTDVEKVPKDWRTSLPYGTDEEGERTIERILSDAAEAKENEPVKDVWTADLFAAPAAPQPSSTPEGK